MNHRSHKAQRDRIVSFVRDRARPWELVLARIAFVVVCLMLLGVWAHPYIGGGITGGWSVEPASSSVSKGELAELQSAIERLRVEKDQLDQVVSLNKAQADALLATMNPPRAWYWRALDIVLSVIGGIVLNSLSAFLWDAHKARRAGRPHYYS